MGNCLQCSACAETGKQFIKVVRMDGKMLEYSPPLLVRDLLIESGNYRHKYMVVHSDNISKALPHDSKLEGGQLYYLIQAVQSERVEDGGTTMASSPGAVNGFRLKIVVSKQQLKALLSDGFVKEKVVEQLLLNRLQTKKIQVASGRWRPCLERISEVN